MVKGTEPGQAVPAAMWVFFPLLLRSRNEESSVCAIREHAAVGRSWAGSEHAGAHNNDWPKYRSSAR